MPQLRMHSKVIANKNMTARTRKQADLAAEVVAVKDRTFIKSPGWKLKEF